MTTLVRLQLRRLRGEARTALPLVLLVFVTALLLALGPRLLERISNQALGSELESAQPIDHDVIVSETSRASADVPATADDVKARTAQVGEQLPPRVAALIAEQRFVVDSTSWEVISGTQFQSLFFLRIQQDVEQHVELVAGKPPSGHTGVAPDPRPGALPSSRATVYEAMVSQATADEMGVSLGQDLPLRLARVDPRNGGADIVAVLHIAGIYRVTDPADPFWLSDPLVAGFRFHPVGTNTVYVEADALLSPDAYPVLEKNASTARLPLAFQWRYYLDPSRVDANRTDELMAALRRLQTNPVHSGVSDVPSDTTVRSDLLRLLQAHEARWFSATALLSVVGMGALFVAATCLTLLALVASAGRRRTAALAIARGASGRGVRLSLAAEGLLLSLPACGLALAAAWLAVPDAGWLVSVVAALLVVVAATALLIVTGVPATGPAAARQGGDSALPRARRLSARQLVLEGALVAGAIVGAVILRERGVAGITSGAGGGAAAGAAAGPAGSTVGADPLMIAVPALVGLAAGIIALRLYPLITALAATASGFRRGIVFALASRRAARGRSSAAVLVTIVATASVAGFAAAGWTTLDQAAETLGWQQVGAPFRASARDGAIPAAFDPAQVAGVSGVAAGWAVAAVVGGQPTTLVALDAPAYAQMTAATPADQHVPPEMLAALPDGSDALPAVASADLGLHVGDGAGVTVGSQSVAVRALTLSPSFAPLASTDRFLLVDRSQLGQLNPAVLGTTPPSMVFIAAPQTSKAALESAVAAYPDLDLASQADAAAVVAGAPVSQAVSFGLAVSALAAAAYAALAVAAAFVLAATDQRVETAYLRVMGLTRSQRLRLIFAEHVPAAIVAAFGGGVLGVFMFIFVRPALGLPTILPESADVSLGIDAFQLAALLAAALLIVLPAWALAAFAQRDTDPAAAVREGTA